MCFDITDLICWLTTNADFFLVYTHTVSHKMPQGLFQHPRYELTIFSAEQVGLAVSGSGLLRNVCKENDVSMMIFRKPIYLSVPTLFPIQSN